MNIVTVDIENFDVEHIRCKKMTCSNNEYTVLSSKIQTLPNGDIAENPYPAYRSIILNDKNELLCVAPPSSMKYEDFCVFHNENRKNGCQSDIMANELIEGTMINLFHDARTNSWEIATRSSVGCNYWFTRREYGNDGVPPTQKSFREMFLDAIGTTDLNSYFELYEKKYCYSFVLQHPENHIVLPIQYPCIYLVSIHEILPSNENKSMVSFKMCLSMENMPFIGEHATKYLNVYVPRTVPFHEMYDDFEKISEHYAMGIMITHLESGKRTPVVNKTYETIKKIRGNNPNLQFHFFELIANNKINEFLSYFPNYAPMFSYFSQQYQDFITQVHQAYFTYYVKKERDVLIPKKYFIHAAKIHHDIYIPEKRIIKRSVVAEYFNKMSPSQLIHYISGFDKPRREKKIMESFTESVENTQESEMSAIVADFEIISNSTIEI